MQPALFHILFLGVALFQLLFILVQWYMFRRIDYWYYMGYITCCIVYVFFKVDAIWHITPFQVNDFFRQVLDQPVIITAFWMYIRFGYYFLNLKKLQPRVYEVAHRLEFFFIAAIIIICITIPFPWGNEVKGKIFLLITLILSAAGLPVIIGLIRQKNLLNNFLIIGSLCIVLGGMSGPLIAIFLKDMGKDQAAVFTGIEIGILLELLLLNTGFILKNRILQQQVIQAQERLIKEYESQNRSKPS